MGYTLSIESGPLYPKIDEAKTRVVINYGGSRSGKTFTLMQWLIVQALSSDEAKTVTVVRKTLPSLKITVLKDFLFILKEWDLYDETKFNKTELRYQLNHWEFQFESIDDSAKKRGAKRQILFCNEASEIPFESYMQLSIRTTERIFLDYNPSTYFWADEHLVGKDDVTTIHSTYLDNPFLEDSLKQELEKLKEIDEQYYKIYALGLHAGDLKLIYTHHIVPDIDTEKIANGELRLVGLGLDFGFTNDETACVELYRDKDNNLYINELFYQTGMTTIDIANALRDSGVDKYTKIWADSSEPRTIHELYKSGFNIHPIKKGPGSVVQGIDILKRFKLHATVSSTGLIKEFNNYKWQVDKNDNMINTPVDKYNHALDALRYVAMAELGQDTLVKRKNNIRILGNRLIK